MENQLLGVGGDVPKAVKIADIHGYDGKYWAGTDGHIYVFSKSRTAARKPRPFRLAESEGSRGYLFVAIIHNERKRTINVHQLICEAWHGRKPQPSLCVRHLDGNKKHNCPTNVKWGTYAENEADKRRHGRIANGAKQGSAKLTDETVRIIRASIPRGLWNSRDAAHVFGVKPSTINQIARGRGWQHVT